VEEEDRVDAYICEAARIKRIARKVKKLLDSVGDALSCADQQICSVVNGQDHGSYFAELAEWDEATKEQLYHFDGSVSEYGAISGLKEAAKSFVALSSEMGPLVAEMEAKIYKILALCPKEKSGDYS
jgi:hypothetical protein